MPKLLRAFLVVLAALSACRREPAPTGKQAVGGVVSAPPESASVSPPVPSSSAEAPLPVIARLDGRVSVEPEPACAGTSKSAEMVRTETWLSDPEIQAKRPGEAIERELERWKASAAGTYLDDARRAFGVVLHQDFTDYEALRSKLEPISAPLRVVLRPACYSRQAIDDARRVLMDRKWHPRASETKFVFYFDASTSAFSVGIADAEVAKALDDRLDKLVRTHAVEAEPVRSRRTPRP